MSKKGLSDIITTVLIIMLSLAAIVLIWGFIRNQLSSGGVAIAKSTDCLSLTLQPVSCTVNTTAKTADVVVRWADGDVNLQQIAFLVSDSSGTNSRADSNVTLQRLATARGNVSVATLTGSSFKLSAAGIIKTSGGDIGSCSESLDKIACTNTP